MDHSLICRQTISVIRNVKRMRLYYYKFRDEDSIRICLFVGEVERSV